MSEPAPLILSDLSSFDHYELQRSLDIAKTAAFVGKSGAYLGTILCATPWVWSNELETAGTDSWSIVANPGWWLKLPRGTRATILLHELWHIGACHHIRGKGKHSRTWNYATDIWINNRLVQDGYTFEGFSPWLDESISNDTTEEEIYQMLLDKGYPDAPSGFGTFRDEDVGDFLPPPADKSESDYVNRVVGGIVANEIAGSKISLPPAIEKLVNNFLKPAVPWEQALQRWLTELANTGHTWSRPNRRHQNIYLPSRTKEEGKLRNIRSYIDVSGSIDAAMATRFFSEMKFVKDFFKPDKLTIVQFDTDIQDVLELNENDSVESIELVGRGGTCLQCVHDDIVEHRPSAVVILTDGECSPMAELPFDIPLIWIIMRNNRHTVKQGTVFHINN